MPLQLSIRDNRRAADFGYTAHQNCTFEELPLTVGGGPACHCRVENADTPDEFFRIRTGEAEDTYILVPAESGKTVYVNNRPVNAPVDIRNGDEIRIEHWTFRFFRIHPSVGFSRRADMLAMCSKVLVVLIFAGEVTFAVWLPRQLNTAQLWQKEIAEQKTVKLLERLKGRVNPETASNKMSSSAQRLIEQQIDKQTAFIRKNREKLSAGAWERLREELITYRDILGRIRRGEAWQELSSLNLEEGVNALMEKGRSQPMFSVPEKADKK